MTDPTPQTRAEARELDDDIVELPTIFEGELVAASQDFLPLGVRRVLYLVAIAGLAAAPVIEISMPELALAIGTASSLLGAVALGTALANPTR